MWQRLGTTLAVAAILTMVAMELLRSVVHARRRARDGLGGTQDIALWGSLCCLLLFVAALACWLVAWWS